MRLEGFQHFQPGNDKDHEAEAEAILNRITENDRSPLTESEKETLRKGGYGDLVDDIEKHQKDSSVKPWMH